MTLPDPYTLFIHEVSVSCNTDIVATRMGRPFKDCVRPAVMKILWQFGCMSADQLGLVFNIATPSVYYNIYAADRFPELYNKILQIYIDTLRKFIHLNNQ